MFVSLQQKEAFERIVVHCNKLFLLHVWLILSRQIALDMRNNVTENYQSNILEARQFYQLWPGEGREPSLLSNTRAGGGGGFISIFGNNIFLGGPPERVKCKNFHADERVKC